MYGTPKCQAKAFHKNPKTLRLTHEILAHICPVIHFENQNGIVQNGWIHESLANLVMCVLDVSKAACHVVLDVSKAARHVVNQTLQLGPLNSTHEWCIQTGQKVFPAIIHRQICHSVLIFGNKHKKFKLKHSIALIH